ncbi:alpha/beta fold hydrolase [Ornithinicoccus halotolerans]|uniref:alpha/beta fold hydrolase n=1 Tax=Ornithinicoccus halotolerans TaxID=1748220 RepID=UPI0018861328
MSPLRRPALLGAGVAVAGVATAAGIAVDRLWEDRRRALALGAEEDFEVRPSRAAVVVADDGVPLHVEVDEPGEAAEPDGLRTGTAPRATVVLSHGYTLDRRCWVYQRRALRAAGYRVVVWDQRGHGLSGRGEGSSYQVDQLGADLARVIQEAAPEGPLLLVGHSMGGMTVMALAEQQPDLVRARVRGVALVSTSAGGLHRITWGLGSVLGSVVTRVGPAAVGQLASRQELVDVAMRGGRRLQEFIVYRASFASPVSMAVVRLTADMIFGTPLEVVAGFGTGLNSHDKTEALQALAGVEALVLNGDRDLLTSPVHSEEIVERLPHAEHVLVTDAGHIIMLEHPETVTAELLALATRALRAEEGRPPGGRHPARTTVTDLAKRRSLAARRPRRRER